MPLDTTASEASEVRDLAASVAERVPGARASLVFGSYARGTAVAGLSDVDLLVWVEDREAAGSPRGLADDLWATDVSVLFLDIDLMLALCREDWSFAQHLGAENLAAFGDVEGLTRRLRPPTPAAAAVREEIAAQIGPTRRLGDSEAMGGEHLVAYGHLFARLKAISILDGILAEERSFDRHEAIEGLARRRPELAPEVRALAELEPFWLRLRRRVPVELPWRPRHDAARLAHRAAAATRLLEALSRPR